jgi:hypothetical protein
MHWPFCDTPADSLATRSSHDEVSIHLPIFWFADQIR